MRWLARKKLFSLLLPLVALGVFVPNSVRADVVFTGDVSPDPSTWTSSTNTYVGKTTDGVLTIDGGSQLFSRSIYLAYGTATAGTLTVDGSNSKLTNTTTIYLGNRGTGTLNITNNGTVDTAGIVAGQPLYYPDSAGTIHFENGGTLVTKSLNVSPTQMTGTGTINTSGIISDVSLTFDSTASFDSNVETLGMSP